MPAAQAYVLVDVDTGRIIDQSNDRQLLSPASLTKVLTAMVAINWLPPATPVVISARAANVEPDRIGMKAGELWPLDEVIQALLIFSANDAAYALAEAVGVSAENFNSVLNYAASEIGMADKPVFHDPSGLDDTHGVAGGNLVSARDLAIAARDLLSEGRLAQIVAQQALTYTGPQGTVYNLASHNKAFLSSYPGAVGVKTGFTNKAGVCVAAAATRNGRTMLAVVLHGTNPNQTAKVLLDEGFATPSATEPTADALPAVTLPRPPSPAPPPTAPPSIPAPRGRHLALGSSGRPAVPTADTAPATLWPAGAAVALLVVVAGSTLRSIARRRPPLTHGRRT